MPFGGCKVSGLGAEGGIEGEREFLRLKCVHQVAGKAETHDGPGGSAGHESHGAPLAGLRRATFNTGESVKDIAS